MVEAARRVAQLRGNVPEAISQHFRERLQACRPILQASELEMAAGHADTKVPSVALSPAPAELKGKLANAAAQMPMLRCRMTALTPRISQQPLSLSCKLSMHISGPPARLYVFRRGDAAHVLVSCETCVHLCMMRARCLPRPLLAMHLKHAMHGCLGLE